MRTTSPRSIAQLVADHVESARSRAYDELGDGRRALALAVRGCARRSWLQRRSPLVQPARRPRHYGWIVWSVSSASVGSTSRPSAHLQQRCLAWIATRPLRLDGSSVVSASSFAMSGAARLPPTAT